MVFAFALLMVFLVLAALYESWSIPFAVILAIPFGILGALLAIWTRGLTNDIYFQIGLVTLIGLAAKNAILIVEFANQRYAAGVPLDRCRARSGASSFSAYHHDFAWPSSWVCFRLWWLPGRARRAGIPSGRACSGECWLPHFWRFFLYRFFLW